tara:strand:+ start:191 stop:481 length:291 start_codon:yes stop_codon:yes gene_type:complete
LDASKITFRASTEPPLQEKRERERSGERREEKEEKEEERRRREKKSQSSIPFLPFHTTTTKKRGWALYSPGSKMNWSPFIVTIHQRIHSFHYLLVL